MSELSFYHTHWLRQSPLNFSALITATELLRSLKEGEKIVTCNSDFSYTKQKYRMGAFGQEAVLSSFLGSPFKGRAAWGESVSANGGWVCNPTI